MQRERETSGSGEMTMTLPNASVVMDAQRAATENATRMANAACHYALSVNRAWLDLWGRHLNEYMDFPKRLMNVQTDFLEHAFDHYQESLQKLGSLTAKARDEAESALRETEEEGERFARRFQSEAKEMSWSRPKENPRRSGSEESRESEQQRGAH